MPTRFDKLMDTAKGTPDTSTNPLDNSKENPLDSSVEDGVRSLLDISNEELTRFKEVEVEQDTGVSTVKESVQPDKKPQTVSDNARQMTKDDQSEKTATIATPRESPASFPDFEADFSQWEEAVDVKIAALNERRKKRRRKTDREEPTPPLEDAPVQAETVEAVPPPEFPEVKIVLMEPMATVLNMLIELFDEYAIEVLEASDFEDLKYKLEQTSLPQSFAVAFVGAVSDDEQNIDRVEELHAERPELPIVFLSNHDLSHMRRRTLLAGATFFIEKPDSTTQDLVARGRVRKRFCDDVILWVTDCHARNKAVYELMVHGEIV